MGRTEDKPQDNGDKFVRRYPLDKPLSAPVTSSFHLPDSKPTDTRKPVAALSKDAANSLQEKIVGTATIYGANSQKPVKAVVKSVLKPWYYSPKTENKETFSLYVQNKEAGYTTVTSEGDDLYVNYMEATDRKHYTGVGTVLHQIAVEASLQRGHQGRVMLDALDSAVGFHYKSGFRTTSKKLDDQIRREINKANRKGIREPEINVSKSLLAMHLPSKKIREWKDIIAHRPILNAQNKP